MMTLSSGSPSSFRWFSIIQFFKSLCNISRYHANITGGCNVVLATISALVLWGIKHQAYISILFHKKLAHNQHKPTNKTEHSLFHIPSPIIGFTELFSILFKFENSSREIDTAKLTWSFIASHYDALRGSQ